jgi:hypothetical protein
MAERYYYNCMNEMYYYNCMNERFYYNCMNERFYYNCMNERFYYNCMNERFYYNCMNERFYYNFMNEKFYYNFMNERYYYNFMNERYYYNFMEHESSESSHVITTNVQAILKDLGQYRNWIKYRQVVSYLQWFCSDFQTKRLNQQLHLLEIRLMKWILCKIVRSIDWNAMNGILRI